MAEQAHGIAIVFDEMASRDHLFQAVAPAESVNLPDTVAGTWDLVGETNEIEWNGDDPTMTKGTSGDATVTYLRVRLSGTISGILNPLIALIDHSANAVTLSQGDTIVYTSIKIEFETDSPS